jgi:tetratricopeptide (TPR) repeat protein
MAVVTILLALTTNVASSLVPQEWTKHHALLVWVLVAILAVITTALTWVSVRSASLGETAMVHQPSGPVVVAHAGASVTIQTSDPASPAPVIAPGQIVAGELPGRPPVFVRRPEVEELRARFTHGDGATAVSVLSGGRGAGKTQIAAEYARQAIRNGVPIVAWIPAEEPGKMLSALAEVAVRIGAAARDDDSQRAATLLRDALAARDDAAVLIFDNAVDPEAIRPYLPGSGPARIVVTSTSRTFASIGSELLVGSFDRSQSVAYLTKRTTLDDQAGADAIAETLDDLPLALAQAATVIVLRGLTYPRYREQIDALSLDEMLPADRGDAYPRGLAAAILLSIETVESADGSGVTNRILNAVALLSADGVRRETLAKIVNTGELADEQQFDELLGRLVAASLMVWTDDRGAIVMHRLVARTVQERVERAGGLFTTLDEILQRLQPLEGKFGLDPEWDRREQIQEQMDHLAALWEAAARGARAGVFDQSGAATFAMIAVWAVTQLTATSDLSRAVAVGTSLLQSTTELLGADAPETVTARTVLASAVYEAGDYDEAIRLFTVVAAHHEPKLGLDAPLTLNARNGLALAYKDAGRLQEAVGLLEDLAADFDRLYGYKAPSTLTIRNNLAYAYRDCGDLEKAIPLLEEVLADSEATLGIDHLNTVGTRNNLAIAYKDAGEFEQSIQLFTAIVSHNEQTHGDDHPLTIVSRLNLGGTLAENGRLDEAIALLEDVIADCHAVLGLDHPNTLKAGSVLAGAYKAAGDPDRALPLLKDVLARHRRISGDNNPSTIQTRVDLANVYENLGDADDAVRLLEEIVADSSGVLGPEHPSTLIARHDLALVHAAEGRLTEAIPLLKGVLVDAKRALGPDHPLTRHFGKNLKAVEDDRDA